MNATKKLKELGFSKISFHKPNPHNDGEAMVLDNFTTKYVLDKKTNSYVQVKETKIHPKQDSHWKLNFNGQYVLWVMVKNNIIDKIYLENKSIDVVPKKTYAFSLRDDLTELYNFNGSFGTVIKITSKKQIFNLLPKEIRRDFLLKDLLK